MSEFDFADSFGVFDFGVPDFAGFPEPIEIPEIYELPPELVVPGFVPFDDQFGAEDLDYAGFLEALPDQQPGPFDLVAKAQGHLRAAAKEGTKRGRALAESVSDKAERYEHAAKVTRAAFGSAKRLGAFAKGKQEALTEAAADSRRGAAVGRATRRVAAELQGLPGLSAPADVLRAKNAIGDLAARVEAEPDNPYAYLWLGEALKALERDTRVYVVIRALAQPGSLASRYVLKVGAGIGAETAVSASDEMLRRAFALADQRLRRDDFDADALHAIARVYLAKGAPETAVHPATLALRDPSHPSSGAFFFTLARAYLAAGQLPAARRAAERSIAAGTTLGYELLADLLFAGDAESETKERHQEYVQLFGQVAAADRTAYYGVDRSGSDALKTVLASQKAKLVESVERGKSGFRSVKAEVKRRRGQA
jgi:hypothetical protein